MCRSLWKRGLEKEREASGAAAETDVDKENENDEAAGGDAGGGGGDDGLPPLFGGAEAEDAAYLAYNRKYCTNYVRSFFNAHIDDPWFRTRLSALETVRRARKERARASAEASSLRREIVQSLGDMTSGVIPKRDPDCPDHLGPPRCNFVASCRLGVGTKPTDPRYRDHGDPWDAGTGCFHHDAGQTLLQGEDRNRIERHAKSHLHAAVRSESAVRVDDVPPHVSDEQVRGALGDYCASAARGPKEAWGDDVHVPGGRGGRSDARRPPEPYHRSVFAVFASGADREACLEGLAKANEEAGRLSHRGRRRDGKLPRTLELDVDCTDVYGRRDVDSDGRGGAPPGANAAGANGKGKDGKDADGAGDAGTLPPKRCTVLVTTQNLAPSQPVSVLSAAVSSRRRVAGDRADAAAIARSLDGARDIPADCRLDALLELLYPGPIERDAADDEDLLDVTIAYLRRVHLFSFYNGCALASDVGAVLSYGSPVGVIHLRLRDADGKLDKAAGEDDGAENGERVKEGVDADGDADMAAVKADGDADVAAVKAEGDADTDADVKAEGDADTDADEAAAGDKKTPPAKDMLVTRLDESIAGALETTSRLASAGPGVVVDAATDAAAAEIESAEDRTRRTWLAHHSLDEEGRARCSFARCRKLFKDTAFLHKHLLKKHSDHLRAECAKCHDGPMMRAWDGDECRPVPPVLVDCGLRFGLVPSPVVGASDPAAADPEPDLRREEKERAEEAERIRGEREEIERRENDEYQRRREAGAAERRRANFVDPDEMVEEKVELSLEAVVVAPPPKKKRKKKKLL